MNNNIAIKVENLSKIYKLYNAPVDRLKEALHPLRKKYHREFYDGKNWALEFSADVNGKSVKGIDLIEFNDEGKIINFEVLIRPLSGLIALGEDMNRRFANAGKETKPLIK